MLPPKKKHTHTHPREATQKSWCNNITPQKKTEMAANRMPLASFIIVLYEPADSMQSDAAKHMQHNARHRLSQVSISRLPLLLAY